MIERQAEHEIAIIDRLLNDAAEAAEQSIEGWETSGVLAPQESRDYASDQRDLLAQLNHLAIVALNRVVELNMRRLLSPHCPPLELRLLHKMDYLKKNLRSEFAINLEDLRGFYAVGEVRALSNAVKHTDTVTEELAEFPGWIHGSPLAGVGGAYDRLSATIPQFLATLETRLPRR